MDNLIKGAVNKIKQFANTTFNTKFMPGQQMTLAQGFNKATQNLSQDFGNVLRGTGGITGQPLKNPIIPKVPIVSNLAQMSGNTGQSIASGVGGIARGGSNIAQGIQNKNLFQVGQGIVNTGFGAAQIAAPTTPFFQAGNILSQSGGNLTQRIGKGMIQGQTGITGLAPNVKEQKINVLGMNIDPVVGAASLAGFTQNPAWTKIFGQTSKLAQFGLKGVALKGGVEGLIQGLDQLPNNPSQKDITNTLLTNIAMGTGAEVGSKAVGDLFKRINGTKLVQSIKNDLSSRLASDTVVTAQGHMPKWKAMLKGMMGEDIYTNKGLMGKAESSFEIPSQKVKVVNGKIKVTAQTPELTQPKIDAHEKLGKIMYEDRQNPPYPWMEWSDKLKRWIDPSVPSEAIYGKKGLGLEKPKRDLPNFTKEQVDRMASEATVNADANRGDFMKSTEKWIAKRDAAKTTGIEGGLKVNIPDKVDVRTLAQSIELGTPSTPEVGSAVKTLKTETDRLFNEAKKSGIDIGYKEDYIPHAWKESPEQVRQLYKNVSTKFGFSGERTIPTYEEGIKMGLTPKFNSPKQLVAEYISKLEKTKANIEYINELKKQGVIVPKRAPGLVPITAPGFQAPAIRLGDETIREGTYYAPPKIAETINRIFNEQKSLLSVPAKIVGKMQDVAWSGGVPGTPINAWGGAQATKEFLAGRVKGPLKALWNGVYEGNANKYFSLPENLQAVREQQLNNIPVRTSLNIESLAPKSVIQKVLGNNIGEVWGKLMNEGTFKRFMPTLQTEFYKDAKNAALRSGIGEQEAIKIASDATKNFYALQSTAKTALSNKGIEDALTTFIAAPKYRNTMINFWFNNLKSLKNPLAIENRANVKFSIGAITTLLAMDQLNRKFNGGKSMAENPPGKEDKLLIPLPDGTVIGVPFLSSIATMPRALYRQGKLLAQGDIKGAAKDVVQSYSSVGVKPMIDVATNQDYFGKAIVKEDSVPSEKWTSIAKYLGSQYLTHPYLKELTDPRNNQDPAYQRLSRAIEMPFRFYDAKTINTGYYYGAKETAMKGMNEQEKQAFNAIPKSNIEDPNTRMLKYQIYLTYPEVFKAKQKIEFETAAKTGKAIDPLYLVNYDTAKKYMRYESLPEGSSDRKDMTKAYPELIALFDTRSKFFQENPITGTSTQVSTKPIASDYVNAQMNAKNWKDPQVQAYLNANTAYNNAQREKLGLPPLAGFSKFPTYTKKPKKVALRKVSKGKTAKFKTIATKVKKLKAIKAPSFKLVKTKQPKIKVKMPKV